MRAKKAKKEVKGKGKKEENDEYGSEANTKKMRMKKNSQRMWWVSSEER